MSKDMAERMAAAWLAYLDSLVAQPRLPEETRLAWDVYCDTLRRQDDNE